MSNSTNWVNLTKHVINLNGDAIPPSGKVARVLFDTINLGMVGHMPAISRKPIGIDHLPGAGDANVTYIVPSMVLDHLAHRTDVVAPDSGETAVRDSKGHIKYVTRVVKPDTLR